EAVLSFERNTLLSNVLFFLDPINFQSSLQLQVAMSWLPRSLANSLRLDEEEEQEEEEGDKDKTQNYHFSNSRGDEDSTYRERDLENRFDNTVGSFDVNEGGGVKEDLSELKQTLTRQLWGVASFLAPPPPPPPPPVPVVRTVKLDLNRIESVDRSNLSGESEKEYVGDYLGYSNYEEEEEVEDSVYDAVGVTNEALTFARNIAHHPETWLDFSLEEEEFDGMLSSF
ncbi:hypothetical protein AABB24_032741, partial [Solanum stoloniferum]